MSTLHDAVTKLNKFGQLCAKELKHLDGRLVEPKLEAHTDKDHPPYVLQVTLMEESVELYTAGQLRERWADGREEEDAEDAKVWELLDSLDAHSPVYLVIAGWNKVWTEKQQLRFLELAAENLHNVIVLWDEEGGVITLDAALGLATEIVERRGDWDDLHTSRWGLKLVRERRAEIRRAAKQRVMSKKDLLARDIEKLPEPILDELLDFVCFLKSKMRRERSQSAIAMKSSLKEG